MNLEQSVIVIFENTDQVRNSSKMTYTTQKNPDLFFCQYPVIMYVSRPLRIEAEECSSVRCASVGTTGPTFAKQKNSSQQQRYFMHAFITASLVTIFVRLQRSGIFNEACFNNFLFKFHNRLYGHLLLFKVVGNLHFLPPSY
jgi:hypothetical protein